MTHGQLKGALLEYLVRCLLANCGFTTVRPDNLYIFAQKGNGLFFINGKGAAHDADVLMEPPIQMPFSYPSRLLFECKAYQEGVGLGIIRNALGLRYDINEFEIVTVKTLKKRQNNKRATYAISNRKRYNYQVGVASVEEFSKPAVEFAANNKIPLISLRWFLSDPICDLFSSITKVYSDNIEEGLRQQLYTFLKDKRKKTWDIPNYSDVINFLHLDEVIGKIITNFNSVINRSFVGLLETGDLIFLFATQEHSFEFIDHEFCFHLNNIRARLHFIPDTPDVWELELIDPYHGEQNQIISVLKFHVPNRIMLPWSVVNFDKNVALDLKEEYFSRIFIFPGNQSHSHLPFFIVNIDKPWLDNIREGRENNL